LLVGSLLGAAELGVLSLAGHRPLFEALATLPPSRLWFAGLELLFSLGAMIAYRLLWDRPRFPGWLHAGIGFVGGTNLVYHFPALFSIVGVLSERADLWHSEVSFRRMLIDPETLARGGHFLLASIAVTGLYLAALAARQTARTPGAAPVLTRYVTWGARLALLPTLLQFIVGLLVLLCLPNLARDALLGQNLLGTALFGGALIATLGLAHHLAAIALGDLETSALRRAIGLMLLVVVFMVGARWQARQAMVPSARPGDRNLAAVLSISTQATDPQPVPF